MEFMELTTILLAIREKCVNSSSILHHFPQTSKLLGLLPNMGYVGMCGPKWYGFSAVLVISRVKILAYFGHFGPK